MGRLVPGVGVEPTQARGPRDFKSLASTVSATPAQGESLRGYFFFFAFSTGARVPEKV